MVALPAEAASPEEAIACLFRNDTEAAVVPQMTATCCFTQRFNAATKADAALCSLPAEAATI